MHNNNNEIGYNYHLRHTEAMAKIVKWHRIVVFVDLVEPFAQCCQRYIEFVHKSQIKKHCLHQMEYIFVLPFVRIECGQSEGGNNLCRQCAIANFQKALLHLGMLW